MTVALLAVASLLGACALIWIVSTVRRDGDAARTLLTLACNGLPARRAAWGQAMLAELTCVHGRGARWRFALGGIRAAVTARTVGRLRHQPSLAAVLAGLLTCVGLATTALVNEPSLRTSPKIRPFLIALVVVLAIYAAVSVAGASDPRPTARRARRRGLLTGVTLAVSWFVFAAGWWNLHGAPLLLGAVIPFVAAAATARSTGSAQAGVSTATWAGLVAGIAVFVAFAIDGFATAGGPYDASQLAEFAHSGYANITAYWMGEDLAAALLLMIVIPCLTIAMGAIGAVAGNVRPLRLPHRRRG